jgi:hypothetical protein
MARASGMPKHVHLNGSVNLDTVAEVFSTCGTILGKRLKRIPDGEPGGRRMWISYQMPVLRVNTALTTPSGNPGMALSQTKREGEEHRRGLNPNALELRPGKTAKDVSFPELGYALEAIASYQEFKKARAKGKIAKGTRFQVCLPTPAGVVMPFVQPHAHSAVEPAYEKAMLRDVKKICAEIPHKDLAIQWDVCIEMVMFDGRFYPGGWPDPGKGTAERLVRISKPIPRGVELGIHLCYGDLDGAHFIQPQDLGKAVELANIICKAVKRPINWISMPVPRDRSDDAFFAPLKNLKMHKETELVLGLVHSEDGVAGTKKRIATASKYAKDFAIATECGIGRKWSPKEVAPLLKVHAAVTAA